MSLRWLVCVLICWTVTVAQAAPPEPFPPSHVLAELVSDAAVVRPGDTCWLAVHMTMEPGYHTYWVNSGDSGMPTRVHWTLPAGASAEALQWPYPERLTDGGVTYVYTGQTWLLTRLHVPAAWAPGTPLPVRADVTWLSCHGECTQGKATLHLALSVGKSPTLSSAAKTVAAAVQRLPQSVPAVRISAARADKAIDLTADVASPVTGATFFPQDPLTIEDSAPQPGEATEHGYRLRLTANTTNPAPVQTLNGVLVLQRPGDKPLAVSVSVPVAAANSPHP